MMVAEVMMMISAMRVTVENVPGADGVDAQREQRALRRGNHEEVPDQQERHGDKRRHQPLDAPLDQLVLSAGCLSPSMRLAVMSAQMPASEAQTQVRSSRLGQYVGLKNAFQNLLASWPVPATREPRVARRQHEVRMPLMMMSVHTEAPA